MVRIGYGYDIHRVVADRPLVLGGVVIPWDRGLIGHSDADVLLHAVTDAILGALALGDIGQWFPDTDPRFRGADSAELLLHVLRSPRAVGWRLGNCDVTVVAERPRLAPHVPGIRESVGEILDAEIGRVSVKATTNEGLGPVGHGDAIAAHAVVLLESE